MIDVSNSTDVFQEVSSLVNLAAESSDRHLHVLLKLSLTVIFEELRSMKMKSKSHWNNSKSSSHGDYRSFHEDDERAGAGASPFSGGIGASTLMRRHGHSHSHSHGAKKSPSSSCSGSPSHSRRRHLKSRHASAAASKDNHSSDDGDDDLKERDRHDAVDDDDDRDDDDDADTAPSFVPADDEPPQTIVMSTPITSSSQITIFSSGRSLQSAAIPLPSAREMGVQSESDDDDDVSGSDSSAAIGGGEAAGRRGRGSGRASPSDVPSSETVESDWDHDDEQDFAPSMTKNYVRTSLSS